MEDFKVLPILIGSVILTFVVMIFLTIFIGIETLESTGLGVLSGFVYFMFRKPKHLEDKIIEEKLNQNREIEDGVSLLDKKQKSLGLLDSKDYLLDKNKILLGKNEGTYENFVLSSKMLNAMALILGATGSGKTTTIKTILENPIKNGEPVIIIDGKGSPSFYIEIKELCKKNNRNFKLFHTNNEFDSFNYQPLKYGGYTELKDKIISLFDWSDEHWKLQAERYLQGIFRLLSLKEAKDILKIDVPNLKIFSYVLNQDNITSICEAIGEEADFMMNIINELQKDAIYGITNRIQSIVESELSNLFENNEKEIDLLQSIENNDVVFFSLDSLKFAEYSKMLGRIIIADLKTIAPKFYGKNKNIYCVFDEFNVFASDIVVNLINKTREYGFCNILSTQELADMVDERGSKKLLHQIWGNTNVKIAMRQDLPSSQKELADSISTKDEYKVTVSESTVGSDIFSKGMNSSGYSSTLEEKYIYEPREFGQLGVGEAIAFYKYPEFKHAKIKIRRIENV